MKKTKILLALALFAVLSIGVFIASTQSGKNLKGLTAIEFEPKLDLIELDPTLKLIDFIGSDSPIDSSVGSSESSADSSSDTDSTSSTSSTSETSSDTSSESTTGEDVSSDTDSSPSLSTTIAGSFIASGYASKVCLVDENDSPISGIPTFTPESFTYYLATSNNPNDNCYILNHENETPLSLDIRTDSHEVLAFTTTPLFYKGLEEKTNLPDEIARLKEIPTVSMEIDETKSPLGTLELSLPEEIKREDESLDTSSLDYPTQGVKWCLEDKEEELISAEKELMLSELPENTSRIDALHHCYFTPTSTELRIFLETTNYTMLQETSLGTQSIASAAAFTDTVPQKLMVLAKKHASEAVCDGSSWTLDSTNQKLNLSIQGHVTPTTEIIASDTSWKNKIIQVAKALRPSMWMASLFNTPDPLKPIGDGATAEDISLDELSESLDLSRFGSNLPKRDFFPGFESPSLDDFGGVSGGGMGIDTSSDTESTETESGSLPDIVPYQTAFSGLFLLENTGSLTLEASNPSKHHVIETLENSTIFIIGESDSNTFRFSYNPAPSDRVIQLRGLCPSSITIPGEALGEAPSETTSETTTESVTEVVAESSTTTSETTTESVTEVVAGSSTSSDSDEIIAVSLMPSESTSSTSSSSTSESASEVKVNYSQSSENEAQWNTVKEKVKENSIYDTKCDHGFRDVYGVKNEGLICVLKEMGIVKGKTPNYFGYHDTTTVAEFIKMLLSMAGEKESSKNSQFTDGYHWGEGWLARAEELDILRKRDGFPANPNLPITKADAVLYTMRLIGKTHYPSSSSIEDVDVDDYFAYAVLYLKDFKTNLPGEKERDLIPLDNGRFHPYDYFQRGEATEFIVSLFYAEEN